MKPDIIYKIWNNNDNTVSNERQYNRTYYNQLLSSTLDEDETQDSKLMPRSIYDVLTQSSNHF